jgi:hypothetical protein
LLVTKICAFSGFPFLLSLTPFVSSTFFFVFHCCCFNPIAEFLLQSLISSSGKVSFLVDLICPEGGAWEGREEGRKGGVCVLEGSTLCYCCQGFKCNWGFSFNGKKWIFFGEALSFSV